MRVLIYLDTKIPPVEYAKLIKDYGAFIKKHTGITVTFWTEQKDFTDYPTVLDSDGDDVIRPNFLQQLIDDTEVHYGDYGADNIITLIHEDNWKSGSTATRKGISGTNYSYKYGNYHVQYCRWWARKGKSVEQELINTFGTINHEIDHTFDALVQVETGININSILGVTAYDADTTHGGKKPYKYIRYQENADKLKVLAPYLASAYRKRVEKHEIYTKGLQNTAMGLLERVVTLWKQKIYQKNGIKK
jgi:hypothetical protein